MTAYAISTFGENPGGIAFKAGLYPIRIVRATSFSTDGGGKVYAYRYTGSTISGGTALDVVPMRQGTPPSATTARWKTISVSGTARLVWLANHGDGYHLETAGTTTYIKHDGASVTFQPPYAFVIGPGNVFHMSWPTTNTGTTMWGGANIYFEEMRPLQGCF